MWDTLSKVLNIILGLWVFYLYYENRKLKGFEIDKNIRLKEIEIRECAKDYLNKISPSFTSLNNFDMNDYENKHESEIKKLEAELEYLKRLKEYKWPFGKK